MENLFKNDDMDWVFNYLHRKGSFDCDLWLTTEKRHRVKVQKGIINELVHHQNQDIVIRVFSGHKLGLVAAPLGQGNNRDHIKNLIDQAIDIAQAVPEDPHGGPMIPEKGHAPEIFDHFDPQLPSIDDLVKRARILEEGGLSIEGVTESEGVSLAVGQSFCQLISSTGWHQSYQQSFSQQSGTFLAGHGQGRQIHGDGEARVFFEDLGDPFLLGQKIGQDLVAMCNPRRLKTQKTPVIFSPDSGASLLGMILSALNGAVLSSSGSFLQKSLGEICASSSLTIKDDPHKKRSLGAVPFDGEGMWTKPSILIQEGVCQSWILDQRSARKLNMLPTGHGFRGGSGMPSPQTTDVWIVPPHESQAFNPSHVKEAIYVTDFLGSGFDVLTGDWSVGIQGFWMEDGVKMFPINEMTLAGSFQDVLKNLQVGDDLIFNGTVNSPTLATEGLTIAGL